MRVVSLSCAAAELRTIPLFRIWFLTWMRLGRAGVSRNPDKAVTWEVAKAGSFCVGGTKPERIQREAAGVRDECSTFGWMFMDDSILECANGECSFAKNSESIPDYSTSQSAQISPIYLGCCLYSEFEIRYNTDNSVNMTLCTIHSQFGNTPFKTESTDLNKITSSAIALSLFSWKRLALICANKTSHPGRDWNELLPWLSSRDAILPLHSHHDHRSL